MNEPQPDFNGAGAYVMIRFEQDLSPALVYHNAYHTFEDVLPAATQLAQEMGLDRDCALLIRTAAVFHDTGFLEQVQDHESRSIATRLPQRPDGLAQQIICDADLDVLGRDNFLEINRRLLEETRMINAAPPTDLEWYSGQLRFLEGHRYFTPAARALRDPGKQRNIAALKRLLQQTMGHNPARRAPIDNT
jgi:uncharacterized protein